MENTSRVDQLLLPSLCLVELLEPTQSKARSLAYTSLVSLLLRLLDGLARPRDSWKHCALLQQSPDLIRPSQER